MIAITSWLCAALLLVCLVSFVVLFQERFIYFPPRYSPAELEQAKTTMGDMVRAQIHFSLGRLLRHRFNNVTSPKALLSQNQAPEIYIFHGEADEVIPLKMGRALAQLDPSRIKFVEIPRARHNDVIEMALPLGLQSALFEPKLRI